MAFACAISAKQQVKCQLIFALEVDRFNANPNGLTNGGMANKRIERSMMVFRSE